MTVVNYTKLLIKDLKIPDGGFLAPVAPNLNYLTKNVD